MTPLPSLRQLRYLLALHDLGHFGRAAAASFVTQSTLSAGIAELERVLGVSLVERTKRMVRFTSTGEALVERARQLVRAAEDFVETARAASQPLAGDLRLAVIPTIAPFVLPRLLPLLRTEWPALRLFLREAPTPTACAALHRGDVDCVLLALPFDCGEIEAATILTEPLLLGVPDRDAGDFVAPVSPGDVDLQRLLLLEDGHCLRDHALAACSAPRPAMGTTMVGTSLHTLVQMVGNGLGVTLLPRMAIEAGILAGSGVTVRAMAGDTSFRCIALVWRKGSARAADYRLLATTIGTAIMASAAS